MLKKTLLIILTFFFLSPAFAWQPCVTKGSLIKVFTKIPLSTENLQEGSPVHFIVPNDVWVLENKAIAKGDIFYGYVSMLKLPIQGVNAAMSINITDLVKTDGTKVKIKGRIIFNISTVLGGNLTNPASYNKTIHPRKVYGNIWGGTLQYVPSGEYEFGRHVTVNSRNNLFVELNEDLYF